MDHTQTAVERQDRLGAPFGHGYNACMNDLVRTPIVAGAFYPAQADRLRDLIEGFVPREIRPANALQEPFGLVVPHAGYVYSGRVAALGFAEVARHGVPDTVIILGASHTGIGPRVALAPHQAWETPLGTSPVDGDIVRRLQAAGIQTAEAPFAREHSIEVQVPFVQHLWGTDCPIVPMCVVPGPRAEIDAVAVALADALEGRHALTVASSDFTHYQPHAVAEAADREAIDRILALDAPGFRELCRSKQLSICGTGAIEILITTAQQLRLSAARLVTYATSGEITGDNSSVVGYASILFSKESHG